jgi:hypothetical protein
MLKRYWFIIDREDPFGSRNVGVSANSKTDAFTLILESFTNFNTLERIANLDDSTEIIEDIDIRKLDQNHVIPNMGVISWRGVWWPNFNKYEI